MTRSMDVIMLVSSMIFTANIFVEGEPCSPRYQIIQKKMTYPEAEIYCDEHSSKLANFHNIAHSYEMCLIDHWHHAVMFWVDRSSHEHCHVFIVRRFLPFFSSSCKNKLFFICESNVSPTPSVQSKTHRDTSGSTVLSQELAFPPRETTETSTALKRTILPAYTVTSSMSMTTSTVVPATMTLPVSTVSTTSGASVITDTATLSSQTAEHPVINASKSDAPSSCVEVNSIKQSGRSVWYLNDTCFISCKTMCNKSDEQRNETIRLAKERFKFLKVDKKATSKYRRSLTSSGDERYSSAVIGHTAVVVIVTICLTIVLFDLSTMYGKFRRVQSYKK